VRPRIRLTMTGAFIVVLLSGGLVAPGPAQAAQVECAPPEPSPTQPGYTVADPRCDFPGDPPFTPLTDADGQEISEVFTEIRDGAATRIEVPLDWNGNLVLWAHGFRGTGQTVWVDSPSLREHLVGQGFAWAASSYQTNGYDVGQGVRDTHPLIDRFAAVTGRKANDVYLHGASMGGHITAVAVEHHPGSFTGAMPVCGVLGDVALFDYFTDVTVTAAALTGTPVTFPLQPPEDYPLTFQQQVLGMLPELGSGFATGGAPSLTPLGERWAAAVAQRSGGTRPGFASSFAFWNAVGDEALAGVPFVLGRYPGLTGGTAGIAPGNVVDNRDTVYQLDGDAKLSPEERRLNKEVLRVEATAAASGDLTGIPAVEGEPGIPVLSLHTLGDLFVPFSMEQVYAQETAEHSQEHLLVTRAIRANGHCEFTLEELAQGFDDLVAWTRTGKRPAGDPVLDPAQVAEDAFGCRFTVGDRADFVAPPCP
jgi:hypothetical protein